MERQTETQDPPLGDIDTARLDQLIAMARDEDLGTSGDITSAIATLPPTAVATVRPRCCGTLCGGAIAERILQAFDGDLSFTALVPDGNLVDPDTPVARISGPTAGLLTAERTLLNFMQRLSGIATTTRQYVDAIAHTAARTYDTRKTAPGWRDLDKYAVRCGGGHNHRHGLHDAILIKDNHLVQTSTQTLSATLFHMLNAATELPHVPDFVEVEVDSLTQLDAVFDVVGIDVILLDNFSIEDLQEAVRRRDALNLKDRVALEASGGIDLHTVRAIAESGVDRIAIGALTHSAPALDLGLDIA
jgi:nicotinate-nucleotide pyrophosphorylase (carboxylating)